MWAVVGVLAAAAADRVGVLVGPVVADDPQPARRAIKLRSSAASAGTSPVLGARRRAPCGVAERWSVAGVVLEALSFRVPADIGGDINSPCFSCADIAAGEVGDVAGDQDQPPSPGRGSARGFGERSITTD